MPAAIHTINPDTSAMELMVASWFAAGHEVLWIPIVEVGDGKAAIAQARAEADALGRPYLLESIAELARLPSGVKGWLFPAHLDDTLVVAMRNGGDVIFGALRHPVTGDHQLPHRYGIRHSEPAERGLTWLLPATAPSCSSLNNGVRR